MDRSLPVAGALLAGLALGGCARLADDPSRPTPGVATATASPDPRAVASLRVDFSAVTGNLAAGDLVEDVSGNGHSAVMVTTGPVESLTLVEAPAGELGVQFPSRCDEGEETDCPRAILEVADAPELNPQQRDFSWGAQVLLRDDQTSKGSNVVQKGFSTGGRSQWKLQVDGQAGRPSCVIVGADDTEVYLVAAPAGVADGEWHDVRCRREGDELSIRVDGELVATAPVPAGLVVEPPGPVRVGGKNAKQGNDQYFGAVANIFLAVDRT